MTPKNPGCYYHVKLTGFESYPRKNRVRILFFKRTGSGSDIFLISYLYISCNCTYFFSFLFVMSMLFRVRMIVIGCANLYCNSRTSVLGRLRDYLRLSWNALYNVHLSQYQGGFLKSNKEFRKKYDQVLRPISVYSLCTDIAFRLYLRIFRISVALFFALLNFVFFSCINGYALYRCNKCFFFPFSQILFETRLPYTFLHTLDCSMCSTVVPYTMYSFVFSAHP